uniref:Uncharacterized protein n=1 Tax=viral metagenome TaxID=1070528 RepID=A0A6H1ZF79_9ZZZZ
MGEATPKGVAYRILESRWQEWKDLKPVRIREELEKYGVVISRQRAHQLKQQIVNQKEKVKE